MQRRTLQEAERSAARVHALVGIGRFLAAAGRDPEGQPDQIRGASVAQQVTDRRVAIEHRAKSKTDGQQQRHESEYDAEIKRDRSAPAEIDPGCRDHDDVWTGRDAHRQAEDQGTG